MGCKFVQGSCLDPADYPYACTNQFTSGCTFDYFATVKMTAMATTLMDKLFLFMFNTTFPIHDGLNVF